MRGKKLFALFGTICLALILVVLPLAAACEEEEAPPAEEEEEEEAPPAEEEEEEEAPQVFELSLAYGATPPDPERFSYRTVIHNWVDKIEEETNGRVQIEIFPGGSLLEYSDIFQGVATGIADIGYWSPHYDVSWFTLHSVLELAGIPWTTTEARLQIIQEMYDKFPELLAEFEGTKPLFFTSLTGDMLCIAPDMVVRTPADLEGMLVGCSSAGVASTEALGGAPVEMHAADYYLALERGVIEAATIVWGGERAFKLYEVCESFTHNCGLPRSTNVMVINEEVWNSFPLEIQEVFNDLNEWAGLEISRAYEDEAEGAIQQALDAGRTVYEPTPEELALWADALSPIVEEWVQEREAEGLPAEEILEELMRLLAEY